MAAVPKPASPRDRQSAGNVDPAWRRLYLLGAYACALFLGLTLLSFVLVPMSGLPSSSRLSLPPAADTLSFIAGHRTIFVLEQLTALTPAFLTLVTFMALYAALKEVDRVWAAIGAVLAIVSLTATLSVVSLVFGLVSLSDQLAATSSEAQRTAITGAAASLIVQYNVPSLAAMLWPAGILAISVAMIKGVFPRAVAYLGLVVGVLGVAGEAAFPVLGPEYILYGTLLVVWLFAVSWRLYRLGRDVKGYN